MTSLEELGGQTCELLKSGASLGAGSVPRLIQCSSGPAKGRIGGLGPGRSDFSTALPALCSRQSEERAVLFAVASALVNCTNSYDYEEPDPKMVELAKYAKQHVPEQHPKVRQLCKGLRGSLVIGTR